MSERRRRLVLAEARRRPTGHARARAPPPAAPAGSAPATRTARNAGYYVREYRNGSTHADPRARPADSRSGDLGPRDEATTLQALELVNGEILTSWLMRGARRMTGELPPIR